MRILFPLWLILAPAIYGQVCASCHPKETAGFGQSAMAHSLRLAGQEPDGSFEFLENRPAGGRTDLGTRFESRTEHGGVWQSYERGGEKQRLPITYTIGSGSHALGFLAQVGAHLFQSPISYYTLRRQWDVAPGYEQISDPDFSRPVTMECLTCHADRPLPVLDSLNSYRNPPFAQMAIGCDRCHGPATAHLKSPVAGSIVNPAKLPREARDSICEQCHLAGEVRIPNAGKAIADFQPGQRTEEVFTVYVAAAVERQKSIKVVSHSEQLAQSVCARESGGRLWCGTCHNPHETPVRSAEYFRERCLACHAASLERSHAAAGRDCVGCHMPQRPAKDGGHTAFTDHRIARRPEAESNTTSTEEIAAWREPDAAVRDRNLALALVTVGLENRHPDQVIRGYRMLNRMKEEDLSNDAVALTTLGTVLLKGKQPAEAEHRFVRALELRPGYGPYEVNLAVALLDAGNTTEATRHLERAVQLDPLLQQGVELLSRAYRMQKEEAKADALIARYRTAMGIAKK